MIALFYFKLSCISMQWKLEIHLVKLLYFTVKDMQKVMGMKQTKSSGLLAFPALYVPPGEKN